MKICRTCKREYEPSSRHKDCPSCRAKSQKTSCTDCGELSNGKHKRCIKCHNRKVNADGTQTHRFKGGKWRTKRGYVWARAAGHPRATKKGHYVYEHILVMEEKLGRYLKPDENVHHLNGVKWDNRPENLELWIKPQPAGIRTEDAVKWAQEVLERYAPELLHGRYSVSAEPVLTRGFEPLHLQRPDFIQENAGEAE